jgi:RNA polymerase sigma-70 factor (ECF subfamily)
LPDARAVAALVGEAHRGHWAEVLGATVRFTRDLDLAEDCAQEAFVRALRSWPDAVPDNPAAWLTAVARREAVDRLRRESTLRRKLPLLVVDGPDADSDDEPAPTDPLRLVFTCCHPALARDAHLALTLRLVCGLTTEEVAEALLVPKATAAARITRAKKKIALARIPFHVPDEHELAERLDSVLTVVHVLYSAGHTSMGEDLIRADLAGRAVDLARTLVRLMPDEPEPQGLLALLLLGQARAATRVDADGQLVLLADQDRRLWDRRLVNEGVARATDALTRGTGRFTLQAAIAGLHSVAESWESTDWAQVLQMYDALMVRWPSPVVAHNRAAAHSLAPGADLGAVLAELDGLMAEPALARYAYLPATRADVLRRMGRPDEARGAYDEAIGRTSNDRERRFLRQRRAGLGTHPTGDVPPLV